MLAKFQRAIRQWPSIKYGALPAFEIEEKNRWSKNPTLLGLFEAHAGAAEFIAHVGQIWLIIGIGGLVYRTVQLFLLKDVQTGLVWMTKILTDPFHDIKLYYKAPIQLLRGELFDTMAPQEHA